jgi:hypothetical protein
MNPKLRRDRLAQLEAYTPARVLEELHTMGGTLETLEDGKIKLTGTGHAPSLWHEAFSDHRPAVLELIAKGPHDATPDT